MIHEFSERRLDNYVAFAASFRELAVQVTREQTEFLALIGLTWEQARALPKKGQDALNYAWQHRDAGK